MFYFVFFLFFFLITRHTFETPRIIYTLVREFFSLYSSLLYLFLSSSFLPTLKRFKLIFLITECLSSFSELQFMFFVLLLLWHPVGISLTNFSLFFFYNFNPSLFSVQCILLCLCSYCRLTMTFVVEIPLFSFFFWTVGSQDMSHFYRSFRFRLIFENFDIFITFLVVVYPRCSLQFPSGSPVSFTMVILQTQCISLLRDLYHLYTHLSFIF